MGALYLSFFINFSPLQFIPFIHMAHFLHQRLKNLSPNLKLSTFLSILIPISYISKCISQKIYRQVLGTSCYKGKSSIVLYILSLWLEVQVRFLIVQDFWLCYNPDISAIWSSFLLHQMVHYLITSKQREGRNIRAVQRPIRTSTANEQTVNCQSARFIWHLQSNVRDVSHLRLKSTLLCTFFIPTSQTFPIFCFYSLLRHSSFP